MSIIRYICDMAARAWSKKEFAIALGLTLRDGTPDYSKLRRYYLTDELIQEIGLSLERYKRISIIPARYSKKICEELDITEEDLYNS